MASKKRGILSKIAVIFLVIAGLASLFACKKTQGAGEESKPASAGTVYGVVSYEKLIMLHPDFENLKKMDQEISQIGPSPFDTSRIKALNDSLTKKMMNYQKQLEASLQGQMAQIQARSRGRAASIQARVRSAYERKRAELMKYQAQLEKEYKVDQDKPDRPMTKWETEFGNRVKKQGQDLIMLGERQLAAKSLELQKKSQEKIMAEKNKYDKIVADYEDEVRSKNQNAKVDLQLKISVAKDDEERASLEKQLREIIQGEQNLVSARRKEYDAQVANLDAAEKAKNNSVLKKYRAKIDADINQQLKGIKNKVGYQMYREGIKEGHSNPTMPKEMSRKLDVKRAQMQREMESVQAQARSEIDVIQSQAKSEFETRKAEMIGQMKAYQKSLMAEFEEKRKAMVLEVETANSEKEKAVKKLMEQRNSLYESMLEDINSKVAEVAQKEGVDVVLGAVVSSVKAKDLTSQAEEAVRTLKDKASEGQSK